MYYCLSGLCSQGIFVGSDRKDLRFMEKGLAFLTSFCPGMEVYARDLMRDAGRQ